MTRFLKQILLFGLSVLLIYAGITLLTTFVADPPPSNDFMAAMIDKHERAEQLGAPRLLIAGGSNIAFNINTESVEEELGLPAVNLGLNIGLGIRYITREVEDIAAEGDIVFLFFTWYTGIGGTYNLMKHTANHYPPSKSYYRFNLAEEFRLHTGQTRNHLRNLFSALIMERRLRIAAPEALPLEGMYTRENFNEFGDFEGHHGDVQPDELDQRFLYEHRYWDGIRKLNQFYEQMQDQGVEVYFFYPAFPKTEFEKNQSVLERKVADIERDLRIPQPLPHTLFLFDEEYFYDTVFHLTLEGREVRTKRLIEGLVEHSLANKIQSRGELRLGK